MSDHDFEFERTKKIETDENSAVLSPPLQENKIDKNELFFNPHLSEYIISTIERKLPQLIEYFRLGEQKDNISIPELESLQKVIQESINEHGLLEGTPLINDFEYGGFTDDNYHGSTLPENKFYDNAERNISGRFDSKQSKSTLPDSIRNKIGMAYYYNNNNYFNYFISLFIDFKRKNFKENKEPQATIFYTNRIRQNVLTNIDKRNHTLDLLASRLANYLSETFAIINSLAQLRSESWLPWKEFEKRKREAFFSAKFNITGQEQPAEALMINTQRVKLQQDSFEIMKVNSLINAQLWDEKQYREKNWGVLSQNREYNAIDISSMEEITGLSDNIQKTASSQSGGISRSLKALSQGVDLTGKAAKQLFSSHKATDLEKDNYDFSQVIASACEKLNAIIVQLMEDVNKVQPSTEALKDKQSPGVMSSLRNASKKIISSQPVNSAKLTLPPVPRSFEALHLKMERMLTGIISRKAEAFTTEELAAILHSGMIVKDKLQQTQINLAQINQESGTLRFALERLDATEWLLDEASLQPKNRLLIKELEDNKVFWEHAVIEEKRKLTDLVKSKMDISEGQRKALLLLQISDILMTDVYANKSQKKINDYFIEISKFIELVISYELRMKIIPDKLCDNSEAREAFSDEIKLWMRNLQAIRSRLNIEITDLTGWEPASFSRTGMLVKGIAESYQASKKNWFDKYPGSNSPEGEEEYHAAFIKYFRNYLPFVTKNKKAGSDILMSRLEIEMKNIAKGKIIYPTTMGEILSAQKTTDEMFKSWSVRRLIRGIINASFSSFSIIPSFASLPLRIAIKCLVTQATVTFIIDKGGKAIRLGEGSSKLEASHYRKNAFKQLAIKIGVGTLPIVSPAIGAAFLWEDIYKGNAMEASKGVAKELLTEMPFIAQRSVIASSLDAVQQKKLDEQENLKKLFDDILNRIRENGKSGEMVKPETSNFNVLNASDELARISRSDNPQQAKLAQSLCSNKSLGGFHILQSEDTAFSHYNMSTREIILTPDATDEVILHEITHALSAHQVAAGVKNPASELGIKVQKLDKLRVCARQAYQEQGGRDAVTFYYLSSPQEFISGLYSGDSEFTAFLKSIDVDGRSLLLHVLNMLALLLGLETEQESALSYAFGLSEAIMTTPVAEEMEGEQQTLYYVPAKWSKAPKPKSNRPRYNPLNLSNTTIPSMSARNALVSRLANIPRSERDRWLRDSALPAETKKDIIIVLAENHYIYDKMVTGREYFAWVQNFHHKWPNNFQSENRIVGVLRLPKIVSAGDFPAGKGFKFILKNERRDIIFEKIYYPRSGTEKSGAWKIDILSQIESDMSLQDEYNRISVSHIHRYDFNNPIVLSGAHNTEPNVFVIDENSLVESADFQIVNEEVNRETVADLDSFSTRAMPFDFLSSYGLANVTENFKDNILQLAEESVTADQQPDDELLSSAENLIGANKQFDDILLSSASKYRLEITRADLDKEYLVTFQTHTINNYGAANFIPPAAKLHTRKYSLRNIISGNLYRDEGFTLNSVSDVYSVDGINGLTLPVLKQVISDVASGIQEKIEDLKNSSELRSEVSSIYRKSFNTMLMKLLFSEKNTDVIELINRYLSGEESVRTVSVTIPHDNLLTPLVSTTSKVPGMVAIGDGKLTIFISMEKGKYYVMMNGVLNYNIADMIKLSLTQKDAENDSPRYQSWKNWKLTYENSKDVYHEEELLHELYDRAIDRLKSDLDYKTFTSGERTRKHLVNYGQAVLRGMSIIAGSVAMAGSGNLAAAALLVGVIAEMGDVGLSVLQAVNADRGDEYNEAMKDILISSILFTIFSVSDVKALLNIARSGSREFLPIAKKTRAFFDEIKQSPNAGEVLRRGILDTEVRRDFARQILDEEFIEGTISESQHQKLMTGVENPAPTSARKNTYVSSSDDLANTGGTSSSGYQSGSQTTQPSSLGTGQASDSVSANSSSVTDAGGHIYAPTHPEIRVSNTQNTMTTDTTGMHRARLPLDVRGKIPSTIGREQYNLPLTGAVRRNPDADGYFGSGTQHDWTDEMDQATTRPNAEPWEGVRGTQHDWTDKMDQATTRPKAGPWEGVRGTNEGKRFFTKFGITKGNKTYFYRQYDDYKMYLVEGQHTRPGRFMASGHGNTIGTNTVACPEKTTINFYGEHGKLLVERGLISRRMLPSARVRYNEAGLPVTEVPVIENEKVVGWQNATKQERIKFTGTSQPGRYKDINLSYFEHDDPTMAIDIWNLEKEASKLNPDLTPATPRPEGLVVINEQKTIKLSTMVEDFSSVSGSGEAVVDVNACRGGFLRTLLANLGTRGRPSRRYVERTGFSSLSSSSNGQAASVSNQTVQNVRVAPSRRYHESTNIRDGLNSSASREGRAIISGSDFSNTQSVIAQGGSALIQGMRNTKTIQKTLIFVGGTSLYASVLALAFLHLDKASPPKELEATMPPADSTSGASDQTQDTVPDALTQYRPQITVAEGIEKVRLMRNKAVSLRDALTTYDDKALSSLRPLEKEFFGEDDYLGVADLNEIIDLLKAVESDTPDASLKVFLAEEQTTWELQHPVRAFNRLGRTNVIGFLNRVLR